MEQILDDLIREGEELKAIGKISSLKRDALPNSLTELDKYKEWEITVEHFISENYPKKNDDIFDALEDLTVTGFEFVLYTLNSNKTNTEKRFRYCKKQ